MTQWTPADPQSWSMTAASIKADPEHGAQFLVFLNFWLNTAEKLMAEGVPFVDHGDLGGVARLTPANAVRKALELAEQRLGHVDVWFMGQLLVVICTYWIHGDEVARGFSPIELKITGQALAAKLHEMTEEAASDQARSADGGPQQPAPVADPDIAVARPFLRPPQSPTGPLRKTGTRPQGRGDDPDEPARRDGVAEGTATD